MTHRIRSSGLILLCGFGLLSESCLGQGSPFTQSGSSAAGSAGQTAEPSSPAAADSKKKKVWTNEDVGDLSGPISVVGTSKNGKTTGTVGADGSADGQYIASVKKQLEKLQGQLGDTTKQIAALTDFQQGKTPEPAGYQLGKGYNRVPVDQQIASLEQKKKNLEQKLSELLDEARKKGVLPGQLR